VVRRNIICFGRDLFVAWHRAINDDADHFSLLSHPWSFDVVLVVPGP
jgi:hypothetical protein